MPKISSQLFSIPISIMLNGNRGRVGCATPRVGTICETELNWNDQYVEVMQVPRFATADPISNSEWQTFAPSPTGLVV